MKETPLKTFEISIVSWDLAKYLKLSVDRTMSAKQVIPKKR